MALGELLMLLEEKQKKIHNKDSWQTPVLDTREVMLDGISDELDQDL